MGVGRDMDESRVLINAARRKQYALCPKRDLAIATASGEGDALIDQPFAESVTARRRVDQQQTDFCDLIGLLHQKDRADLFAVDLGNPAALACGIEVFQKFRGDLRAESNEMSQPYSRA